MALLVMLVDAVVKKSLPLFLVTLLVTSQWQSGVLAKAAEEECCECDETTSLLAAGLAGITTYLGGPAVANYFGAGEKGIEKGSTAAKMMQAASKSGLGGQVVSTMQKMGTASGARKTAATAAGAAYKAAKNRCCPCKPANREF